MKHVNDLEILTVFSTTALDVGLMNCMVHEATVNAVAAEDIKPVYGLILARRI